MFPTRGIRDLFDVMGAIYAHATRLYRLVKTRATTAALKPHVYLQLDVGTTVLMSAEHGVYLACDVSSFSLVIGLAIILCVFDNCIVETQFDQFNFALSLWKKCYFINLSSQLLLRVCTSSDVFSFRRILVVKSVEYTKDGKI